MYLCCVRQAFDLNTFFVQSAKHHQHQLSPNAHLATCSLLAKVPNPSSLAIHQSLSDRGDALKSLFGATLHQHGEHSCPYLLAPTATVSELCDSRWISQSPESRSCNGRRLARLDTGKTSSETIWKIPEPLRKDGQRRTSRAYSQRYAKLAAGSYQRSQ